MRLNKPRILSLCFIISFVITSILTVFPAYATVTPSSPVLYFSFDDGTPTDLSGNDNHGTLSGPVETAGIKYSGLEFDGNDQISVSDDSSLNFGTDDFSIACWVKAESWQGLGRIVEKKGGPYKVGYSLMLYFGKPLFQVVDEEDGFYNYYSPDIEPINDGNWHFIVVTAARNRFSVGGIRISVDGEEVYVGYRGYRTGSISNTGTLYVGRDEAGFNRFKGTLDELRIYPRIISRDEIKNLYNDFYKAAEWCFEGNIGDTSGNGNSVSGISPSFVEGVSGNALSLNVSSDAVSIPDNPTLNFGGGNDGVTFSYWIKQDLSGNDSEIIIDKLDIFNKTGYRIQQYLNSSLMITLGTGTGNIGYAIGSNEIADGEWHHVAFTAGRSNPYVKIYVDGEIIAKYRASNSNWNLSNDLDLRIGNSHRLNNSSTQLNGCLDEMKFYNRVLTSSEIRDYFEMSDPIHSFTLQGKSVSIGDTQSSVLSEFGTPSRIDPSEYGFEWYIYNQDYSNYVQIGIENGVVVALCSNASNLNYHHLDIGAAKDDVRANLGGPDTSSIRFGGNSANIDYFYLNNCHIRTYYDYYSDDTLSAVFVIKEDIYNADERTYPEDVVIGLERQSFDLANAFRTREGKTALIWCDLAATAARKHSEDMYERNFNYHTNPDGVRFFERMEAEGITYSDAGENIYSSPEYAIEANEGWINSSGHRGNILSTSYTYLGVGFCNYRWTQDFYRP